MRYAFKVSNMLTNILKPKGKPGKCCTSNMNNKKGQYQKTPTSDTVWQKIIATYRRQYLEKS